ncbi:MAG: Gfo/Idh/MocA family protein [Rubripirellula sp.]
MTTPTPLCDLPHRLDYLPSMPNDLSIGIGCIGSGFVMADCHLVAYRNAGLNPVAIASRRMPQAAAVAERHKIATVYETYEALLNDERVQIVDIAVPPDAQLQVIRKVVKHQNIRGVLAQKPLAANLADAKEIVRLCRDAGITLCVNQNMRYDQSIRSCHSLLRQGAFGEPVLASIDMRAIPHWMPWQQRQGWLTCRVMSIHHLDTMRYWFGSPQRVFASFRTDPRTKFDHQDGIGLYVLEYDTGLRGLICDDVWAGPAREGAAADLGIAWRVEGTDGMAKGTIGWPKYPQRVPSTLDYTTVAANCWYQPRWDEVWFPDAFLGPMTEVMNALESGSEPAMNGEDNLETLALVDACYQSAAEGRLIDLN